MKGMDGCKWTELSVNANSIQFLKLALRWVE